MKLKYKYAIGTLVQFYELEMLDEHLRSCEAMMRGIENPENVTFEFKFAYQPRLLEKSDIPYNESEDESLYRGAGILFDKFYDKIKAFFDKIQTSKVNANGPTSIYGHSFERVEYMQRADDIYELHNIARFRRDLNTTYAPTHDFVCWGETDSLWPSQTLHLIEALHEQVKDTTPKYIANFAGRLNWDKSWDVIVHPKFQGIEYIDTPKWTLENEASEKAYMSFGRMEEINSECGNNIQIQPLKQPKADGSCLVISSDLILSGANIPLGMIHCGEDESFLRIAKRLMGDEFIQYNFKNILRVHNRRHPNKRVGVKGESNPRGFCNTTDKGAFWNLLEHDSKHNLETLFKQVQPKYERDVVETLLALK
jgi:hypothetical protein